MSSKKHSKRSSGPNHRSTLSLQKTEIMINVYDLLPVCNISKLLHHKQELSLLGDNIADILTKARPIIFYPLDRWYLITPFWCRYKQSRIRIWWTWQARDDRRVLHTSQDRAARRNFQMRNTAWFHCFASKWDRCYYQRSLRCFSRHILQSSYQKLQPLYSISLREAHWKSWSIVVK